jgi:hypothetical protein
MWEMAPEGAPEGEQTEWDRVREAVRWGGQWWQGQLVPNLTPNMW